MLHSPSFRGSSFPMSFREVWSLQSTLWGDKALYTPWKLTLCWEPACFVLLCPTAHGFNGTMLKGCTRPCVVPVSPTVPRTCFFPWVSAHTCWLRGADIAVGFFFLCTENCNLHLFRYCYFNLHFLLLSAFIDLRFALESQGPHTIRELWRGREGGS